MKKLTIHESKDVTIKADVSFNNMLDVAHEIISQGLVGMRQYCELAKDPMEIANILKPTLLGLVDDFMESVESLDANKKE